MSVLPKLLSAKTKATSFWSRKSSMKLFSGIPRASSTSPRTTSSTATDRLPTWVLETPSSLSEMPMSVFVLNPTSPRVMLARELPTMPWRSTTKPSTPTMRVCLFSVDTFDRFLSSLGLKLFPDNSSLVSGKADAERARENSRMPRPEENSMPQPSPEQMINELFGPNFINYIRSDPEFSSYLDDPDFMEKYRAIQTDPENGFINALQDKRFSKVFCWIPLCADPLNCRSWRRWLDSDLLLPISSMLSSRMKFQERRISCLRRRRRRRRKKRSLLNPSWLRSRSRSRAWKKREMLCTRRRSSKKYFRFPSILWFIRLWSATTRLWRLIATICLLWTTLPLCILSRASTTNALSNATRPLSTLRSMLTAMRMLPRYSLFSALHFPLVLLQTRQCLLQEERLGEGSWKLWEQSDGVSPAQYQVKDPSGGAAEEGVHQEGSLQSRGGILFVADPSVRLWSTRRRVMSSSKRANTLRVFVNTMRPSSTTTTTPCSIWTSPLPSPSWWIWDRLWITSKRYFPSFFFIKLKNNNILFLGSQIGSQVRQGLLEEGSDPSLLEEVLQGWTSLQEGSWDRS